VAERDVPPAARAAREPSRAGGRGDGRAPAASHWPQGAFDADTAVRRREGGREDEAVFTAELSPAWRAMRGPHGGYLAAVVLRALIETAGDVSRAPRSLTVHYARAPAAGEVLIRTRLERRGRSLSTLSARMEQDGAPVLLALAAFSVPWRAPEIDELALPDVAGPDPGRASSPEVEEWIERGFAPVFLRQLVMQWRVGARLYAGADAPMEVGSWLGLREQARPLDAIALAMLSDVGAPPPLLRLREQATASTVDLTIHFRTRTPRPRADPAELCFARLRTRLVHEGFFEDDGVIWAADGTVLAQARQLAVLIAAAGSD
jgi:acyl-CoA thioesterase